MDEFGIVRAEHPERAGACGAEMPFAGADAASAFAIVQLSVKHRGLALDLQRPVVGMKVDRISAPTGGLSADRAIAKHERNRRVAVDREADRAAAARPVEREGHRQLLSDI